MNSSSLVMIKSRRHRKQQRLVTATAALSLLTVATHTTTEVVAYLPQLGVSVYSPILSKTKLANSFSFSAGPPPPSEDDDDDEQPFFGSYSNVPQPPSPPLNNDDPFQMFPSSPTGAGPNPFAKPQDDDSMFQPPPPTGPSPSDDPYYQEKFRQMDAREAERRAKASEGLQDKTRQRLEQLQNERRNQQASQNRANQFEQNVQDVVSQSRAANNNSNTNMPLMDEQARQVQEREIAAKSSAAAAARAKAEELRNEWQRDHAEAMKQQMTPTTDQQKAPFTPSSTPFGSSGIGNSNTKENPPSSPPPPSKKASYNPFAPKSSTGAVPTANPFASQGGGQANTNNPFASQGGPATPPPQPQSGGPGSNNNPFASQGGGQATPPPQAPAGPGFNNPFASQGGQATPPSPPAGPGFNNPFASQGGQSSTPPSTGQGSMNPFASQGGQSSTPPSTATTPPTASASKSVFNFFGGDKTKATEEEPSKEDPAAAAPSVFGMFGSTPAAPQAQQDGITSTPPVAMGASTTADDGGEEQRRREEAKAKFRAAQQDDTSSSKTANTAPPLVPPPTSGTASSSKPVVTTTSAQQQQQQGAGMPSYADTDEFKRRQEAAIAQQEAEEKEKTRLRMLEAKRLEQEANIRRFETERQEAMKDPVRKKAIEEEQQRRQQAMKEKVEESSSTATPTPTVKDAAKSATEEARLARMEAARKLNLEQAKKEQSEAEERRQKMKEAREAAIQAARDQAEKERLAREEAAKARKLEEAERKQAARMKADTKRYQAEAETSRQEIRDFVEIKGRQIQQQQQQQQGGSSTEMYQEEIELRAEEARRWAEEEARRKVGGLPPASDFEGAPAPAGSFPPKPENPERMRVRNVYEKWCQFYGKRFDEARLQTFSDNLYEIESHYSDTGEPVQLNEFADLTAEEYEIRQEDPLLWEENERLRWVEDEQLRRQGLPPMYDQYGDLPPYEDDPWGPEPNWNSPDTRRKPLTKNGKSQKTTATPSSPQGSSPMDAARYRGEFESERQAEKKAKLEEEERKLKEAEEQRLEEAKLRGAEWAKKQQAEEEKRATEEAAKLRAVEEAQKRGGEEAKRRSEMEAKRAQDEARNSDVQRKAMEEAKFRGQSMRGVPAVPSPAASSFTKSMSGPDKADAGVRNEGNQLLGRKPAGPLADDTQRRTLKDKVVEGVDAWQAALMRGEAETKQREALEQERLKKQALIEEEQKKFNESVAERARREAALRQEAAEKKKKQEEEAQKLVLAEAKRRAEEEQRKREEAMAKQQEENKKRAELERQRKEEAKRIADEKAKQQREAQLKMQEERARQMEAERQRREESRRIAAEKAKQQAEEAARQQEERIQQAKLEQERKDQARRKAAEEARRRAQEIEQQKVAQMKQAEEARRKRDEARKQVIAQQRAEQEAKEIARHGKSREAALELARQKAERKEAEKKRSEEQKKVQVEAARRRLEEEKRLREEEEMNQRDQAEKQRLAKLEAAAKYKSTGNGKPFEKPKPKAPAQTSPFGSYMGAINNPSQSISSPPPKVASTSFSPITPPKAAEIKTDTSYLKPAQGSSSPPAGIPGKASDTPKRNWNPFSKPKPQAPKLDEKAQTPAKPMENTGGPSYLIDAANAKASSNAPPVIGNGMPQKPEGAKPKSYAPSGDWKTKVTSGGTGMKSFADSVGSTNTALTSSTPQNPVPSDSSTAPKAPENDPPPVAQFRSESVQQSGPKTSFAPFGRKPTAAAGAGTGSFADALGSLSSPPQKQSSQPSLSAESLQPAVNSPPAAIPPAGPKKSFAPFGRKPKAATGAGTSSFADTMSNAPLESISPVVPQAPPSTTPPQANPVPVSSDVTATAKKSYNPFGAGWKSKQPSEGAGMSSFSPDPPSGKAESSPPKKSYNPFGKKPQASASGMASFADQVSGQVESFSPPPPADDVKPSPPQTAPPSFSTMPSKSDENVNRPKAFAPYGSKPKAAGSGMPSYTESMTGTAEAFSAPLPAPGPSPILQPPPVPAMPVPRQQATPSLDTPAPAAKTTTGLPSYMDRVAKSYVDESAKLKELQQDITRMEQQQAQEVSSPPPPPPTTESVAPADFLKSSRQSPSQQQQQQPTQSTPETNGGGVGIPSFLNRFFGGKSDAQVQVEAAPPKKREYQESADGTLQPKRTKKEGLPFFMSKSSSAVPTSKPTTVNKSSRQEQPLTRTTIPIITGWGQTSQGSIYGFISGSPNFEDGAYIMTSPIEEPNATGGSIVTTTSGSQYRLAVQEPAPAPP